MRPSTHSETVDPLLPAQFKTLISSSFSGSRIGASITDVLSSVNGAQTEIISQWLTDEEKEQLGRYSFAKRAQRMADGTHLRQTVSP